MGSAAGFALGATVASAMGAVALIPLFTGDDRFAAAWAARGFAALALPGILGGAWLAREHGRTGSRFVVALAAGFMLRMIELLLNEP